MAFQQKCLNCGAFLIPIDDRRFADCRYCGSKFLPDVQSRRLEIEHMLAKNDATKLEVEKQKLELEAEEKRRKHEEYSLNNYRRMEEEKREKERQAREAQARIDREKAQKEKERLEQEAQRERKD